MKLWMLGVVGACASCVLSGAAMADGAAFFPDRLSASPPAVGDPEVVLFAPDDDSVGLGDNRFIYSLRGSWLVNGAGADLTVYEADFGAVEFDLVDVLVSADGLAWVSISGTITTGVRVTGDGSHGSASHRKSFDLEGSGVDEARFIKLQGLGKGPASGTNGFDLDAIAIVNGRVPAPGTLALIGGVLAMRRRRRA